MSAIGREAALERTIVIHASRSTVFRFFTDPSRFARWWGEGSRIDPRPGGEVVIRYPDGTTASGKVVEIVPGERILFTYGYESGRPVPPGSTQVRIALTDDPDGTRVVLRHVLPDEAIRDEHVAGWRYQLALFANVAADDQNAGLETVADDWFGAWCETDAGARRKLLAACATNAVTFSDRYGCTSGLDELDAHIGAVLRFFPGVRLARDGKPLHCQGTALVPWTTTSPAGAVTARGTNVLTLDPGGRIAAVVGFWTG